MRVESQRVFYSRRSWEARGLLLSLKNHVGGVMKTFLLSLLLGLSCVGWTAAPLAAAESLPSSAVSEDAGLESGEQSEGASLPNLGGASTERHR
jgi:hypothetical protein